MNENQSKLTEAVVLQVKNLGKLYSRRPSDTRKRMSKVARSAFLNLRAPGINDLIGREFWAVQDVSFELKRGHAIGVIGLNGSGKTTLLRMLAGQIMPDAGEIAVNGTTATMIDLAAGFQGGASGRENIFLRAAALGFSRAETAGRLQEIIDFSEIEHAIDAPLSSYSSGMRMRLAFSVMAMVAPDILFIDEVLAVGDFRFRQKSLSRMREMRSRSAFVFVSHSLADVSRFCDRVIVMHKGRVYFEGPPDEAIEVYEALDQDVPAKDMPENIEKAMGPVFENSEAITDIEQFWCDADGEPIGSVRFDEKIRLRIKFRSLIDMRNLIIGIPVWAVNTQYITGLSTQITSDSFDVSEGDTVDLMLEVLPGFINPGVLKSMLTVLDGAEFLLRKANPDLVILSAKHPTWGVVTVPHTWKRLSSPAPQSGVMRMVPRRP